MTTSLRTTFLRGHTEKQMVKVIRRVVARGSFKRFRFVAPMCIHKEAYDSLGPHEWVFQAAFRSVQPCLQDRVDRRDKRTDRRRDVCSNCPHVVLYACDAG